MKFGLQLVRAGVISAEQLVAALELQHSKFVPIGQLAIEERLMSVRDVFHVLHYQSDMPRPHERFGEIAIEMNLISREELQRLLFLQVERKPPLAEVLVRGGILTQEQVDAELIAFHERMERHGNVTKIRIPVPNAQCGNVPKLPGQAPVEAEAEPVV